MIATYGLNLTQLSTMEKWILLGVFAIVVILGIIDYFYKRHNEKEE